jgi:hypothetical protein
MLKDIAKATFDDSTSGKEQRIVAQKLLKIAKAKTVQGALSIPSVGHLYPDVEKAALDKALSLAKTAADLGVIFRDIENQILNFQDLLCLRYGVEQVLKKADELNIIPEYKFY